MEKEHKRFLAKIEHCQDSSKFCMLVCLGVLNNGLSFLSLDFATSSSYNIYKYTKNCGFS